MLIMIDLFRNANFVRLFIATMASQLGTMVGNMAFAFYLLNRFSSQPSYATIAELMYTLPTLFVFLIVGMAADRFHRKHIAEYSDWIRAGLTIILMLSIAKDWVVFSFLILFLRSAVAKFFGPAEAAMIQGILTPEQYAQAAGLNQLLFGIFNIFGVSLGAAAYLTLGIQGAIMLDGVSFIISALLIRFCKIPREVSLPNGASKIRDLTWHLFVGDFKEGMRYVFHYKLLLTLLFGFFIFGFINGGFAVLPMFTMKYNLAPDQFEKFSSIFSIFLGVGIIIGSFGGALLVKKWNMHTILIAGLLSVGLMVLVLSFIQHVWVYLILVLIIGILLAPVNVAIGGWMPQIIHPTHMGRVNALTEPAMLLAQSATLFLIAWLYPRLINLQVIYYGIGGFLVLVSLYFLFVLPRMVKRHEVNEHTTLSS